MIHLRRTEVMWVLVWSEYLNMSLYGDLPSYKRGSRSVTRPNDVISVFDSFYSSTNYEVKKSSIDYFALITTLKRV